MKTSVIGFPRVGTLRELKFATEKFFRGEINEDELKLTSGKIRKNQWLLQSSKGIDYIASMIFHFMITCLTQQYYLILFPKDMLILMYHLCGDILQWREDIRAKPEM